MYTLVIKFGSVIGDLTLEVIIDKSRSVFGNLAVEVNGISILQFETKLSSILRNAVLVLFPPSLPCFSLFGWLGGLWRGITNPSLYQEAQNQRTPKGSSLR